MQNMGARKEFREALVHAIVSSRPGEDHASIVKTARELERYVYGNTYEPTEFMAVDHRGDGALFASFEKAREYAIARIGEKDAKAYRVCGVIETHTK